MSKDELIEYLINAGCVIKIKEEYIPIDKKLGISKSLYRCKNLPDKYLKVTDKQMYKYFISDCEIPTHSSGNFIYSLREETKESIVALKAILSNPEIDFQQLTAKFKIWYSLPSTVKQSLKKLLPSGAWRDIYDSNIITAVAVKPSNTMMR